ncbi:SLAM family member 6-like [Sardina pilchardus]|uniref:SLAM family member 6-like n=1 Tax=Sardina pilchardus TaxID=27697 RepID=UPI002E0DA8DF
MDAKWILLLHVAILHTVTSAPESVLAQEGKSVNLTMHKRVNLDPDDAVWVFNQTRDVVRYYPHHPKSRQLRVLGPYRGRVEFNCTTFSLELKNLQKTDCGLYRGEINAEGRKTVVEYRLSVYEQVSAPVLAVEPVLSSGDLCNMTVTCTAGDLSLTSTCNSSTCTQKELTGSSSLAIFIRDGVIICSHSNSVSRSQATVDFEKVCPAQHFSDNQNAMSTAIAGGLVPVVLIICAVLVGCVVLKKCQGIKVAKRQISPTIILPSKDQSDCGKGSPAFHQTPGSELKKQNLCKPLVTPSAEGSSKLPQTPGTELKKRKAWATPSVKGQYLGSAEKEKSFSEAWPSPSVRLMIESESPGSRKNQSPSKNKPSFAVVNLSQGSEPKKQYRSTPRATSSSVKKTLLY